MSNFYLITSRYVSLAVIGLLNQASAYATRFEAETPKEAELIGEEIADEIYPERTDWRVVSEAEKMRIDEQPELFVCEGEEILYSTPTPRNLENQ